MGYANINATALAGYGLIDSVTTLAPNTYSFSNSDSSNRDNPALILPNGTGTVMVEAGLPATNLVRVTVTATNYLANQRPSIGDRWHRRRQLITMKRTIARTRRGQTLVEMTLAISLTAVVCTAGISTLLLGMGSWYRGQTRIDVEGTAQKAVRQIAMTLRTAMSVTVDTNGQGLTYRMPMLDTYGNFIQPATWDGVTRRIELDGTHTSI